MPNRSSEMEALYDSIGKSYTVGRREDPGIASNIFQFLVEAKSILNIGAGTGSYEPRGPRVVAVEPSLEMIKQRRPNSAPVTQAFAESLPFDDGTFSHSMTVLSMHHWVDRMTAFSEIKRVTTERFIAVTWNPSSEPFWLTKDYFPEIHAIDSAIFPSLSEITNHFLGVKFYPLKVPANCLDGFTAAYWARPKAYLDPLVRSSMSTFSKIENVEAGLERLARDLESGLWNKKYGHLKSFDKLDVGYILAVWDAESQA